MCGKVMSPGPNTYASVCVKACGKCKWECTRGGNGNTYIFAALDAAAPTLSRKNSTCAVLKNARLCGLVRKHGVCNQSCPAWPGGCQDFDGYTHKQYARTCSYVEQDRECSLATLNNVGPAWAGATTLESLVNDEGIGAYQACCQCGGGTYPDSGAIKTDPRACPCASHVVAPCAAMLNDGPCACSPQCDGLRGQPQVRRHNGARRRVLQSERQREHFR